MRRVPSRGAGGGGFSGGLFGGGAPGLGLSSLRAAAGGLGGLGLGGGLGGGPRARGGARPGCIANQTTLRAPPFAPPRTRCAQRIVAPQLTSTDLN